MGAGRKVVWGYRVCTLCNFVRTYQLIAGAGLGNVTFHRNFHEYLLSHKSIRSKERNALMKLFRGYRNEKKTNESEYLQIVGDSILYGQVRRGLRFGGHDAWLRFMSKRSPA